MRMFNSTIISAIIFCFLPAFVLSCATVKNSCPGENVDSQIWEYSKIPVLGGDCKITDFPLTNYNPPPDGSFRSMFTGKVADDSFQQEELNLFESRLIVQIKMNYVLYGQKREITYYVMIFDFKKDVAHGTTVVPGDILGHVEKSAKVLVFCETLDPCLVLNSNRPPVFYARYFWFNPSFLSATGPAKWVTFDPVDDINYELMEAADHLTEMEGRLAAYDQRVRFKMQLSQYPREISEEEVKSISAYETIMYGRNGIMANITEIDAGGYNYLLCWQNGFLEHLKEKYPLNADVWLCGIIVTYNVREKRGYVFIRDLSPISPEEMYEGRMKELRG